MLTIEIPACSICFTPLSRNVEEGGGPYLDWIDLQVEISAKKFNGEVRWMVMPMEIQRYKDALIDLRDSLLAGSPITKEVNFSGVEPHFSMKLDAVDVLGHMTVSYCLHDFPGGPTMTGSFEADQSYLPLWIDGLNDLIDFGG